MVPAQPTGCSKRSSNEAEASHNRRRTLRGTLRIVTNREQSWRTFSAACFSNLLAFLDGHVLPAMLTGINLVRTEQFVLAKLFKPMGKPS